MRILDLVKLKPKFKLDGEREREIVDRRRTKRHISSK
jgi:hypothetical protein